MKKILLYFILFVCIKTVAQEGNYVETNGVKIYYEIHGAGDPLLLLHGFTNNHDVWDAWVEDLSKKHQLIIPDLRGHGNSTNPEKIFTHKLSAIDMYGLMDSLKIQKFQAIGHSSGAMTLTHMATIDTTRISSMILVAGTSFFPKEARENIKNLTYENLDEGWMGYLKATHPRGEEQIRMLIRQFSNFSKTYDDMNFTPPYLSTIKSQTLIIHGDRDPYFPVGIPVLSYKSIPNSYLWIVPNDGHSPAGIYYRDSIWSEMLYKVMDEFFGGKWE